MSLFCIDIGNTHTHYGVVQGAGSRETGLLETAHIDDPERGLPAVRRRLEARYGALQGLAFCSVVPAASERLRAALARAPDPLPIFQLTADQALGVPITYPHPAEIGQDRLANAAGAYALGAIPAIVIDLGTAVTFDIVTLQGGYEGGVIGPGLDVMRRYLHERTAQLPLLEGLQEPTARIGRSTQEAMQIGMVVGFTGMIQALLDAVLTELQSRGEPPSHLLATGGTAALIVRRLRQPVELVPDLTLRGLAAAYALRTA